jgi:L-alanine-DL-glutamate epimerase-like enolase superfamily enzyme
VTVLTDVRATTVVVPMRDAVSISTRAVPARAYTLVRLGFDDGSSGIGFSQNGGSRFSALASTAVRDLFTPLLLGQDPYRVEGIWSELHQDALHSGRHGAVMRGLSAVDIALWDRNARAAGLPLWRYLGAARTDSVPAYASGGYYYPEDPIGSVAREMAGHRDRGFRAFKMKVAGASLAVDVERVAAVREEIGWDAPLMLDANNKWADDLPAAQRALRAFEPFDPYWIEEPFAAEDVTNHARLAARTDIPLASGELLGGRAAFMRFLEVDAVAYLQPDVGVCGGISEYRRIAATALSFGIPVAPHSLEDLHVHLVATMAAPTFIECFPDPGLHPIKQVIDSQLQVNERGEMALPTRPGLGFEFIDEAIERFSIDGWAQV